MALADIITLACLAAVVFGVFWGRRRGRERFAASMAAAKAEGHAEARAELAAQLHQSVTVVAGNDSTRPLGFEGADDVLIAALRRIAVAPVDRRNDHLDAARTLHDYDDRARLVSGTPRSGERLELPAEWPARGGDCVAAPHRLDDGQAVI